MTTLNKPTEQKKTKEPHKHHYNGKGTQKVLLSSGEKTAVDIIKLMVCKCGATQAYDLERTIH